MKLVGRALWLLFGLVYRLVVLVLFERWIPFPERPASAPAQGDRKEAQKKPQLAPTGRFSPQQQRAVKSQRERSGQAFEPAWFSAQSREPSPELAAQREGEHWLHRSQLARLSAAPRGRETLTGLLRDKRAVRDAIVLGAALGARRSRR
jgi:hypothetical protein